MSEFLITPQTGPQTLLLQTEADEICLGGARGGGKTYGGILWLMKGSWHLPPGHAVYETALNYPRYRALVLRREAQDLRNWVDEAWEVFRETGAEVSGQPRCFVWRKTGAKIYTDHLNDEQAYNKYRGWNLHRILLEELTEVPQLKWYLRLFGSLRSQKDGGQAIIKPQLLTTTNPDGVGHCVPHGEVLTPGGWVDIKDVRPGDSVFSVDPSTGEMLTSVVDQAHSSLYDGDLIECKARGFELCCTPNHKVLRHNTSDSPQRKFFLEEVSEFPGQAHVVRSPSEWRGSAFDSITLEPIPTRCRKLKQPLTLTADQYARLTGWMLSEGNVVRTHNAISIAQMKAPTREKLRKFLESCGFKTNWSRTGVTIYNHEWCDHYAKFGKCRDKFIPSLLKNAPRPVLQSLLETLMDGDGHKSGTGGEYYTTSRQLADDVSEIAIKCGYAVYCTSRQRPNRKGLSYAVSMHRQTGGTEIRTGNHKYTVSTSTRRINANRIPFSGRVYCIGVRGTHTFIIRQGGSVWVSGNSWVKNRFINLYGKGGVPIPPNTVVRDPVSGMTRIFIPARLEDNKFLDTDYENRLKVQAGDRGEGEATYQAWRWGRWDIFEGAFFPEFRPNGPMPGEPIEANHCYESEAVDLASWWPMAIGLDWGFQHEAAGYFGRWNQEDKRLYVCEEFITRKLGSRQLGQEIAKRAVKYLEGIPDHHIPLFLSHDAFRKDDDTKTRAQLFIEGLQDVLGAGSAHLAVLTDSERLMAPVDAWASMESRYLSLSGGNCITVHQARSDRDSMAAYVREILHWKKAEHPEPDLEYARKLLLARADTMTGKTGLELYEDYMERFRPRQEVLPRVKIERSCRRLTECIGSLVYDKDNTEVPAKVDSTDGSPGDDPYDGFCYLVMGMRVISNRKPKDVLLGERMKWFRQKYEQNGQAADPAIKQQVLHHFHDQYDAGALAGAEFGAIDGRAREPFSIERMLQ